MLSRHSNTALTLLPHSPHPGQWHRFPRFQCLHPHQNLRLTSSSYILETVFKRLNFWVTKVKCEHEDVFSDVAGSMWMHSVVEPKRRRGVEGEKRIDWMRPKSERIRTRETNGGDWVRRLDGQAREKAGAWDVDMRREKDRWGEGEKGREWWKEWVPEITNQLSCWTRPVSISPTAHEHTLLL